MLFFFYRAGYRATGLYRNVIDRVNQEVAGVTAGAKDDLVAVEIRRDDEACQVDDLNVLGIIAAVRCRVMVERA